mgnify:CR=1 FL=1
MTMTTASMIERAHDGAMKEADGDVDPAARPRRRSFTGEYKNRIVDEYDSLERGSSLRGALLRREGLYSSHVSEWRNARERAAAAGLEPKAKKRRTAVEVEVEKLRRRNAKLETELERTKLALEITGKAHALLELLSESADTEERSKP